MLRKITSAHAEKSPREQNFTAARERMETFASESARTISIYVRI